MLTLPSTWDEALHRPVKATWLIQLYYDSTNYVGLSFEDIDYLGTPYYGAVLNKPSIRDAMNLAQSKASTSNISLSVANFKYNGADFSEELFGGTNKYINKDCKIYLYLEDAPADTWDTLTTNWDDEDRDWDAIGVVLQIYQGRIEKMSHTADKINISIKAKRPWDFISIPNSVATTSKVYEPVAYGNFTGNTKTGYYITDLTAKSLYPIPMIDSSLQTVKRFSTGDIVPDLGTYVPEYYDSDMDKFFPMTDSSKGTAEGTNFTSVKSNLNRTFNIRPISDTESTASSPSGFTWANPSNAYDTDTNSYMECVWDGATANNNVVQKFTFPDNFQGDSNGVGTLQFTWETNNTSSGVGTISIEHSTDGSSWSPVGGVTAGNSDSGTKGSISVSTPLGSEFYLKSRLVYVSGSISGYTRVKDVNMSVNVINGDDDIEHAYFGEDGLQKTYSGGSGAATTIQEAHRDILKRYAGVDDSDGNITGWSALDTARSGWTLRYWLLEPEDLEDVLNKLQKEGAFVFMYRPDGTMRYWYLPNKSGTSADHTLTKHDVSDLKISHTDFSSLITKWELHSERHPAEDRHITSATLTNSSARTDWNIQTEENTKEVKLDALVANVSSSADPSSDNTNDNWAGYYDGILGDVGIIVSGKAFGKFAVSMEIGDVVEFSDAPTSKFFGSSYSGKIFVITKTQKTTDAASFTAVEIRK